MENALRPLSKSVLIPLELTVVDIRIHKNLLEFATYESEVK